MKPHTFCSYCGTRFSTEDRPRTCGVCQQTTWFNPAPVVVMLVPILGETLGPAPSLLTVLRNNEPQKDCLALPSGYIESKEPWQKAAVRELREETGIERSADEVQLYDVHSADTSDTVLIFAKLRPMERWEFDKARERFKPNREVSDIIMIERTGPHVELAFSTHMKVVDSFWNHGGFLRKDLS